MIQWSRLRRNDAVRIKVRRSRCFFILTDELHLNMNHDMVLILDYMLAVFNCVMEQTWHESKLIAHNFSSLVTF